MLAKVIAGFAELLGVVVIATMLMLVTGFGGGVAVGIIGW